MICSKNLIAKEFVLYTRMNNLKEENLHERYYYLTMDWMMKTPESDAQDFTDADRTIFGAESSGDGDVEEVIVEVVVKRRT